MVKDFSDVFKNMTESKYFNLDKDPYPSIMNFYLILF